MLLRSFITFFPGSPTGVHEFEAAGIARLSRSSSYDATCGSALGEPRMPLLEGNNQEHLTWINELEFLHGLQSHWQRSL